MTSEHDILNLQNNLDGEFYTDNLQKTIYATDASVYRKMPFAVAIPKTKEDLKLLTSFANEHKLALTPRTAGTSLAGQCVTDGIVVDTSKYFNKIISFDAKAKTVTVQPGVIRDDLNRYLKPHGLFFGPNTSTSNRCMIGGMVGNNSSGTTSIRYGVTRDKLIALETILSDGSEATFERISSENFIAKTKGNTLESKIYQTIYKELSNESIQKNIHKEFPLPDIHRRNTGYAVDSLLKSELFGGNEKDVNVCDLLCGSEGTLAFSTKITLQLDNLPPTQNIMVCAHFTSVQESLEAVVVAMKHHLYNCELMDKIILDCTKNNLDQKKNRFFLKGDPEAILMLEVASNSLEETEVLAEKLISDLKAANFGYHYPKVHGAEIVKVHNLRKAGLGLLGNIIGDPKAVACIEDTAVLVKDLPNYISEFTSMMDKFGQKAVYYAHAGAGEIHLRPILNLKKKEDVTLFRTITTETAKMVKRYQGSFSGEHGDGIVRSEFIPLMIGSQNYELLKRIKSAFDPQNIMNPGKIVHPYPMDKNLRYEADRKEPTIKTLMNFDDNEGILRLTEKCNGTGECRKSPEAGGTMCPSYRATKDEKNSTRARANTLREFLTNSDKPNKFDHEELHEVFDLCLNCKGCTSECPSNVDISILKAEFLHQYYQTNKISFRTKLFAHNAKYNKIGSLFPSITNFFLEKKLTKNFMGIAKERSIPKLSKETLKSFYLKNKAKLSENSPNGKVYVFCDEFTNYMDLSVGKATLNLLSTIGFEPVIVNHDESGRAAISKGLLDFAKEKANNNIAVFKDLIDKDNPLIGMEPSAILSFRDEYIRLGDDKAAAEKIAKNTFTIEEFLKSCIERNILTTEMLTSEEKTIKIHGHCHQKSLSNMEPSFAILNLPSNYKVTILNTGCCGMAGSFGYEKEHYEISMQVGEDTLFPKLRKLDCQTLIAAAGTSCRHQIKDGVQKNALHPVEILYAAIKK
ncbi:FAD-binding and (Fe-S)-binding domain-containing protein [Flavicella marina]|uniref:FAD-binding and (Fe-S)-binding domain-containing protein n=1 Tax=Flavicella marina TaxID=1475951 RepID=UPI001264094A|nr:FAD-binding and (Fe-S)-binding domain-containing protein [Flavicella marina]